MNKIFKVIFNKTTGKLVVVSELAKAEGKAKSQTDERSSLSSGSSLLNLGLAGAIVLGASFVPNEAQAWRNYNTFATIPSTWDGGGMIAESLLLVLLIQMAIEHLQQQITQ